MTARIIEPTLSFKWLKFWIYSNFLYDKWICI